MPSTPPPTVILSNKPTPPPTMKTSSPSPSKSPTKTALVKVKSKIHPVPLGMMRRAPALVTQREFRQAHGDRLAADLDLNKLGFPILNHRNGIFWILDGQHRIYALLKYGFADTDTIDCEVYEALTDAQMADIFRARDRRRIDPFSKFMWLARRAKRRTIFSVVDRTAQSRLREKRAHHRSGRRPGPRV